MPATSLGIREPCLTETCVFSQGAQLTVKGSLSTSLSQHEVLADQSPG